MSIGITSRAKGPLLKSRSPSVLQAVQLDLQAEIADMNSKIAMEGVKVSKRSAGAAAVSAGVALLAILYQIAGEYREKEVTVSLSSPVALKPLAIEEASLDPLITVVKKIDLRLERVAELAERAPDGEKEPAF